MNYKVFDVVELNDGNLATIMQKKKDTYKVEVINIKQNRKSIKYIDIKGIKNNKTGEYDYEQKDKSRENTEI